MSLFKRKKRSIQGTLGPLWIGDFSVGYILYAALYQHSGSIEMTSTFLNEIAATATVPRSDVEFNAILADFDAYLARKRGGER